MKISLLALFLSVLAFGQNPNTAVFPGAAAADTDLFVAKNRSQTTLNTTINNSITTVVLTSGSTFLAPDVITIESEILHCTTLTTNTLTVCARGQEGTSAASHTAGVAVYGLNSAWHHNQVAAEIKAIEAALVNPSANTVTFTSQTSVTWTHGLGTKNLVVNCFDTSDQWMEWDTLTTTSTSVATVTFTSSQSGRCTALSGGMPGSPGNIATKTAGYTTVSSDLSVLCDATSGAVTITLLASPAKAQQINVKKIDSSSNPCSIAGNGKSIDADTSAWLTTQYQSFTLQYDGTQWWKL